MIKVNAQLKGLYQRKNIYYVRKAVPPSLRKIAGKREFLISLGTDKLQVAILKYEKTCNDINYAISTMIDGTYESNQHDFTHCSQIAAANGRELECYSNIAQDPLKVARLAEAMRQAEAANKLTKSNIPTYLNIRNTGLKISELPDAYVESKKLELKGFNKKELKDKINPLINACNQFKAFLKKDKLVNEITKSDARNFHKELKDRIYNGLISANTANKYLTHLRVLIDTYHHDNDLDAENVFKGLRFTEDKSQRSPLDVSFINNHWLGNPVFDKLHPELKYMLWAMIDTGCGFKELCGLDPDKDIHLDADIPYITVTENGNRKLKTHFRGRNIPLVGLALQAFQRFPRGFQKYSHANGSTNASAAINKFLKHNNLFENPKQSAYSIRHCFKDRLRNHGILGELQDCLMGHKTEGMGAHYGNGFSLEQRYKAMLQIELDFK